MPRKSPGGVALDMDLAEFTAHADDALMRPTGLTEHVRGYRIASDIIAQLGTRSEFAATLNANLEAVVGSAGYARCRDKVVRRRLIKPHTKIILRSDAVKASSGELWLASRVKSTTMAIKGEVRILAPPKLRADDITTIAAKAEAKHRLGHARRNLGVAREALLLTAAGLAAETGWSGDPPYLLNDGWVIGWKDGLRYSEARARELAPEFGVDLDALVEYVEVPAQIRYAIEVDGETRTDREDEYEGDGFAD